MRRAFHPFALLALPVHIFRNATFAPIENLDLRLLSTRIPDSPHDSYFLTSVLVIDALVLRGHLGNSCPKTCHVVCPANTNPLHVVVNHSLQVWAGWSRYTYR